tara:strand:+ start:1330 stop:2115 length:786 start_codon:yes stop_codon:yes gene_type:complete
MANLYTFEIERKNKNSKSKKKNKTKIVVVKPTVAESENGEFFYGQKFNEFINAGFLTKAMLAKKMGNLGGMASKEDSDRLQTLLLENVEAARIVQFYGEAKKLDKEQKEKLKNAQEDFVTTQKQIYEYQELMRDQYSQTADAKAEQRLIEWFVFNFSFYEDEIDGNKGLFPIFQGETFDDKREFYLSISEDKLGSNDSDTLKAKEIFEASFETLIRVVSVWFNKMGTDQESVDKALQDLFEEEEKEEKEEKEEVKEESKDE